MFYNPTDWYWIVGGSEVEVWASARLMYVPNDDQTYLDWVSSGYFPTLITDPTSLVEVITVQALPSLFELGVPLESLNDYQGINAVYSLNSDRITQLRVVAQDIAAGLGLESGSTLDYADVNGTIVSIPEEAIVPVYVKLRNYKSAVITTITKRINGETVDLPTPLVTIA